MCSAVGIQHVCVYQQALTGQRLKSTLLLKQFAISIEGRRHRLLVLPRDRHSRPFSAHIQELSIQETEADKQRNRGEHDLQSANSVNIGTIESSAPSSCSAESRILHISAICQLVKHYTTSICIAQLRRQRR